MLDHINANKKNMLNTYFHGEGDLQKGGEGSKGGKVIGHTKSGKPIYDTGDNGPGVHHNPAYKTFTKQDHLDAIDIHAKEYHKHNSKRKQLLTQLSVETDSAKKKHLEDKKKDANWNMSNRSLDVAHHDAKIRIQHDREHVYTNLSKFNKSEDNSAFGGESISTEELQKAIESDIEKGGAGSGRKVGQTTSGKDVYIGFNHKAHKDFTGADHHEAAELLSAAAREEHAKTSGGFHLHVQSKEHERARNKINKELQKSFTPLEHQELIKSQIARTIGGSAATTEELEKSANDYFEKAKRAGVIGETRDFGGRSYIKTADGWKYHGKGTGEKAKAHKEGALGHHVEKEKGDSKSGKNPYHNIQTKINSLKQAGAIVKEEKRADGGVYWKIQEHENSTGHRGIGYSPAEGGKEGYYFYNAHSGTIEKPSSALNGTWNHTSSDASDRSQGRHYTYNEQAIDKIISQFADSVKRTHIKEKEKVKQQKEETKQINEKGFNQDQLAKHLESLTGLRVKPSASSGIASHGESMIDVNADGSFNAYIPTSDRGPRTDHGGGDDGDGWMSSGQIRSHAEPYIKKHQGKVDAIKTFFEKNGYEVKAYVDYGEKGHVSIDVYAKRKK